MNIIDQGRVAGPVGDPISALILDDDDFDRRRLCRMSENCGLAMNVVSVPTISKMRPRLDEMAFDLIFLDYRLANETGLEALDIVQAHANTVDAVKIMLTGHLKVEVAVAAFKNGCLDYISKDALDPSLLRQTVETVIGRSNPVRSNDAVRDSQIDQAVLDMAQNHLPELFGNALSSEKVVNAIGPVLRTIVREEVSQTLDDFSRLHGPLAETDLQDLVASLGKDQQITWAG